MDQYIPNIEDNIPIPANAADALPDLTPSEELQMRANTIKFIADLTGQDLNPSQQDIDVATELAREMVENPRHRPEFAKYPNETLAFLAGMVSQMNVAVVDDLAKLKTYVVNKLIQEIETTKDAKTRVTALTKLGEIDGVDAFKKRSEMTIRALPIEEVEKELLETLKSIEDKVIDVEVREVIRAEMESAENSVIDEQNDA